MKEKIKNDVKEESYFKEEILSEEACEVLLEMESSEGKKRGKIDLGKDNVLKIFLCYAIPAILGMVSMTSAWLIDGIFVGQFVGSEAVAAINLSMPILNFLFGVGMMISIGGGTLANIKRGEGDIHESNNFYTVTFLMVTTISILATMICILFSREIATLLGASGSTTSLVSSYLFLSSIFFIGFIGNAALDMFLRSGGFPVFPIVCTTLGSAINIVLDYLFIAKFKIGLSGAALATGASQVIPMIAMLIFIIKKSSWNFVKPHFDMKAIREMLFNGSSELLSNVSVAISGFLFNILIMRSLGVMGVAAFSVANYIATVAMSVYWGVASAIGPGVSFNKGMGDNKRVRKFKRVGVITSLILGLVLALVIFSKGTPIAEIFVGDDIEVINLAVHITKFYGIAIIIMGINIVASMYYTSINEPLISIIIASLRSLIVLIVGLFTLPFIFGDNGLWLSLILAEVVTLIIVFYYFKKKPY